MRYLIAFIILGVCASANAEDSYTVSLSTSTAEKIEVVEKYSAGDFEFTKKRSIDKSIELNRLIKERAYHAIALSAIQAKIDKIQALGE